MIWPFLAGITLLAGLSAFSLEILSATRAYTEGESLWSKAQKEAVHQLGRYAAAREEADFQRYLKAIAVPLGDRKARLELEKSLPEFDIARQGFLEGRNHPDDINGMIWLFRNFSNVNYMRRPISIWAEGDALIAELIQEADMLHAAIGSNNPDAASLRPILERINLINARLTPLEDAFSYSLGEASRKIRDLLLFAMLAIAAALMCFAAYISYHILHRSEEFEEKVRMLTVSAAAAQERLITNARIRDQAALLDKARDAIIVRGMDHRILYWNRSAERLYGWTAEEAVGASIENLIYDDAAVFTDATDKVLGLGEWSGEFTTRRDDGNILTVESRWTLVRDEDGKPLSILAIDTDVTERKAAEHSVWQLAFYDPLTGLPNRLLLQDRLRLALASSAHRRNSGALLFIDLDNFKGLNDTFGHEKGDLLLQQKRADLAMYQAKASGRNTVRFFNQYMQTAVSARAVLEADLRQGLRESQFLLYYQPQVNKDGCMIGMEALLRWQHPTRGLVSPLNFIHVTEETALILPLGLWVLQTACEQLSAWAAQPSMTGLSVAVNVSARQFHHEHFVEQVLMALDRSGANPARLKLELTESVLLDDVEATIEKMMTLKAKGVGFSLDDFGTGYSSLSYLKRLPLDQLKIDQSFVRDVLTDHNDAAIACTIVALAESLGLTVIAEGVETKEQRDFLVHHKCHMFQGYFFGRPQPADQLDAFIAVN